MDRELEAFIPSFPAPDLTDPVAARAGLAKLSAAAPAPDTTGLVVEDRAVGGVPVRVYRPVDARGAVVWLHGGGFVMGDLDTEHPWAVRIARGAGVVVVSVGYRRAPEHRFPAALDDAYAAFVWTAEHAAELGVDPSRLAIMGDSAGGGLTVATLVAIRDAKLPLPGAGACLSPWVDLEGIGESMTTKADVDPIVQKAGLLQMAAAYLGGKAPRTPLAAPLYADLSGLPPLLIQVGTAETLLDDASRLAERARKAGVTVSYEPWESMIHVWHLFAPMLDEGQQAIDRLGEFVRKQAA